MRLMTAATSTEMRRRAATAVGHAAEAAGYVELAARVAWEDAGSYTAQRELSQQSATHTLSATIEDTRSDASITRRCAARGLHAGWLAGTPSSCDAASGGGPR